MTLLRDMVQCVGSRLLSCHCGCGFSVAGALRWVLRERHNASQPLRAAASEPPDRPLCSDLPGAHAERSPRPLVLSPFGFCGSRRQWVVNPRTRVSGARDYCRATSPRVYKSSGARDYCRATSPRVYKSSWNPRLLQGNRPPCLQKFLDLDPLRATGPRVWNRTLCPRLLKAKSLRVYKSSSKAGPPGTTSPTAIQISPFIEVKN